MPWAATSTTSSTGVWAATLFRKPGDYAAFENVLAEAANELPMRLLAYCLMPNHWHLVLWPDGDRDLPRYLHWLTLTHLRRYHEHYHTTGTGPIYQGRYKSFPVQADDHFYTVCRYVEQNALRARLVPRAEAWRWSSLGRQASGMVTPWLSDWPLARPADWVARVNVAETEAELAAVRKSVGRGRPLGESESYWPRPSVFSWVRPFATVADPASRHGSRENEPDPFF